jgi:hypothetical protein
MADRRIPGYIMLDDVFNLLSIKERLTQMSDYFRILKHCFFDTAIADIYRAIRGGSLLGAFVQSMCTIDAMAYLGNLAPEKATRANFEKWVQDWMVPLDRDCRPDVLYALRCGLVHTYGYADRMEKLGIKGFSYVHDCPDLHWVQSSPDVYVMNLESHVAEVTVGAWYFFESLHDTYGKGPEQTNSVIERAQKLIYVQSRISVSLQPDGKVIVIPLVRTQRQFGRMDGALACLDGPANPTTEMLANAIRSIYQREESSDD